MKLGVISDIHGNRIALEAVVADGAAQGVDTWWALGDLIATRTSRPTAASAASGR